MQTLMKVSKVSTDGTILSELTLQGSEETIVITGKTALKMISGVSISELYNSRFIVSINKTDKKHL